MRTTCIIFSCTLLLHCACSPTDNDGSAPTSYTLTITDDGNGSTSPSAAITVNQGTSATISATPDTGYSFANWTVTSGTATIADSNSTTTNVTLNSGDATIQANFSLTSPPQHGIVDFESVEGIAIRIDTKDDVISTLGQPEYITHYSGYSYYYYVSLGLTYQTDSALGTVGAIRTYAQDWPFNYVLEGDTVKFATYPYSTSKGIILGQSTMDNVLSLYGMPKEKVTYKNKDTTGVYPRYFKYMINDSIGPSMQFCFAGTTVDDYAGKKVIRIDLY